MHNVVLLNLHVHVVAVNNKKLFSPQQRPNGRCFFLYKKHRQHKLSIFCSLLNPCQPIYLLLNQQGCWFRDLKIPYKCNIDTMLLSDEIMSAHTMRRLFIVPDHASGGCDYTTGFYPKVTGTFTCMFFQLPDHLNLFQWFFACHTKAFGDV